MAYQDSTISNGQAADVTHNNILMVNERWIINGTNATSTYIGPGLKNVRPGFYGNGVINPDMTISQRGDFTTASAATTNNYYLDRWKSSITTVTANKQQITASQPSAISGTSSLKYIATSTGTGGLGALQQIEDHEFYQGQTITLSAYVKSNNTNARIAVFDGAWSSSSTGHPGDGAWHLLTTTYTAGAAIAQLKFYSIILGAAGSTVSITSGDYIEVTGCILNIGPARASHQPRSEGQEIALCQRFYEKSYESQDPPGSNISADARGAVSFVCGANSGVGDRIQVSSIMAQPKRIASPTITIYDQVGNSGKVTEMDQAGALSNNHTPAFITGAQTHVLVGHALVNAYAGITFAWVVDAEF